MGDFFEAIHTLEVKLQKLLSNYEFLKQENEALLKNNTELQLLLKEKQETLENQQEKIRQETEGTVTVAQEKYRLDMTDVQQLFDGKQLYTVVPDNEEITISNPEDNEDIAINPSQLLYFYKEGYDYRWDITQNVLGRSIQFVKLTPTTENPDIEYLLLGIDVAQSSIYRLIEIGKNTTRTTLTLKDLVKNIPLAEDFFQFDASRYPDYFINEAF